MRTGPLLQIDPSAFVADPELLRALVVRATKIHCEMERVLFRQGDPPAGLFIVVEGEVEVSMVSGTGRTIVCVRTGMGSLLGLPGVVGDQQHTMTATAQAGATVEFIGREDFINFMQSESMAG